MTKAERFMLILLDLDMCQHGRHEGDACASCGNGISQGNDLIQEGQAIGYGSDGGLIVVPYSGDKFNPDAWRRPASDAD